MATVAPQRPPQPTLAPGVVFHDVPWADYEAMLRIVGERPIRVTYDQGDMEVFMPSLGHKGDAYLLGRIVDTVTEELEIPVEGGWHHHPQAGRSRQGGRARSMLLVRRAGRPDPGQASVGPENRPTPRPDHRGRCHQQLDSPHADLRRHECPRSLAAPGNDLAFPPSPAQRHLPAPRR